MNKQLIETKSDLTFAYGILTSIFGSYLHLHVMSCLFTLKKSQE
jgi:hypothetical protein